VNEAQFAQPKVCFVIISCFCCWP